MTAPPAGRHRIFLAPVRRDLEPEVAHRHWRERHAAIFARTPHLGGYVQNRPTPAFRATMPYVCAEIWFPDGEAERACWSSDHYRGQVSADEQRFVDRSSAWAARVLAEAPPSDPRRFRVLAFGTEERPADRPDAEVLGLDRPAPEGGVATVLSVWTDEEAEADELARGVGGLAFVCEPACVLAPPARPWAVPR